MGGLLGFSALLAPFGIPIRLAVGAMGAWMIRSRSSVEAGAGVPAVA